MTIRHLIIALLIFWFFSTWFNLIYGIYLAIKENKKLERAIYPKNSAVHIITKNGGLPVGYMKAGDYGIQFAVLSFFPNLKDQNRFKIELRRAPEKFKKKYLLFFWTTVFWVFYTAGLYIAGYMLGW